MLYAEHGRVLTRPSLCGMRLLLIEGLTSTSFLGAAKLATLLEPLSFRVGRFVSLEL